MPISAVSSSLVSDLSQRKNPFQEIRQDFGQLANALENGDLNGAQSAYANIEQVLQTASGASSSTGSDTLQNDFATLGQALQSGDLSQAQSAFAQLQNDAAGGSALTTPQTVSQTPPQTTDLYVPAATQAQNPAEEAVQDYSQLANSLQNGNLAGAQSAYSNLQQLIQAYQGPSNSDSAIQNDFAALGQDLQNGNLTGAQTEFSQLQNDIQAVQPPGTTGTQNAQRPQTLDVRTAQGHHHHHHHGGGAQAPSSQSSNSTSSSSNSYTASTTSSTANTFV